MPPLCHGAHLRCDYLIVHEPVAKTVLVSIKATASIADYAFALLGQLCRRLEGMSHGERGYISAIGSSSLRIHAQYRLYGRLHACTSSTAQVAFEKHPSTAAEKGTCGISPAFAFAREPIRGCATSQRYSRETEHLALRLRNLESARTARVVLVQCTH